MKLLFITEFFPSLKTPIFSGGVEARAYYTALALAKRHAVIVLASRRSGELKLDRDRLDRNLTIHRVGLETTEAATVGSLFKRAWFSVNAFFRALTIDFELVEGSNAITLFIAFLVGLLKQKPVVAWYPDTLVGHWRDQFGWWLGSLGEITEWVLLRLPWKKVITISETVKERLVVEGMSREKIEVVVCGVNISGIRNLELGIKKKKQLIVVSRLVPYKRVDWAIEAFSRITKKYPEYRLMIVGKGPEMHNLKFKIKNLKLESKVDIKTNVPQEDLYREIAQSKLLLHPSLIEGFGIVLVEAAALGTPYVAADIPTSTELHQTLKAGWLFKQNDLGDFTRVLEMILEDKEPYQPQQGIKRADQFDWEALSKKTEEVYAHVLNS